MANSKDFVDFAVELLSAVGPVEARRMFGGHGVYADGVFFAILDDDELFLKTDDLTRPRFVEAGCRMWSFPGMDVTTYFRPPDTAHDDPESMAPWARLALEAALRGRAKKARKPAKARAAKRRAKRVRSTRRARTKA
ncbi:MAG TPA: TfoX/Sxy family protein [Anaeromyxobacteraceae bacterium]|nr:TfoX/Sxy family protein [Anaeromyxobacteraceae bacterium]